MAAILPSPPKLSNVSIRQIRKGDLPDLEWEGEYIHFRRLYTEIFQSSVSGKALLWGAFYPREGLIGQLFVQLISARSELADGKQRAYIYGFRIKVPFRGYGIGSYMLHFIEQDLAVRGFIRITLNVSLDNPGARRLYERNGYRVVANEPGNWSYLDHLGRRRNVHEPAWRMEKSISLTKEG
ncbi:MAG: GNAT family N-acetyltransferase [Anaerolineales bacterium]|jgi:ribosomal protein S18 acetylase RimI-like enzyme